MLFKSDCIFIFYIYISNKLQRTQGLLVSFPKAAEQIERARSNRSLSITCDLPGELHLCTGTQPAMIHLISKSRYISKEESA